MNYRDEKRNRYNRYYYVLKTIPPEEAENKQPLLFFMTNGKYYQLISDNDEQKFLDGYLNTDDKVETQVIGKGKEGWFSSYNSVINGYNKTMEERISFRDSELYGIRRVEFDENEGKFKIAEWWGNEPKVEGNYLK